MFRFVEPVLFSEDIVQYINLINWFLEPTVYFDIFVEPTAFSEDFVQYVTLMNWNLEPIVHCEIYWWNQQYFLEILLTTQTFKPEGTWSKENICRVLAAGCRLVKSRQQNQAHFYKF